MWQLLGVIFATIHPAAYGYNSLHVVDLEEVVCPGKNGYVDIKLNQQELSGANGNFPHIVTFLRSSNKATNITFRLMESKNGRTATSVGDTVTLAYLGVQRRLNSAGMRKFTAQRKLGRRMSARRRGGGRGGSSSSSKSSSRSRSSPAPRPSPPRRRSMNTNSPSYRRRGASTMGSGPRRRSTAASAPGSPASHSRFQTSSGSGYGYTSSSTMQTNYGGRYPQASPSYGYSGTSSYGGGRGKSYSTGTIAAAAVGGAVVGAGTYYMLSRLSRSRCDGYDCCYNCANSCYDSGRNCNPRMDRTLYRDDIMKNGQGFYPNDFNPPLYLRVTAISGEGYNSSSICPPSNWTGSQPFPNISSNDLFVTLTKMEELGDPGGDTQGISAARASQNLNIVSLGLALAMLCVSMRSRR